VMTLIGDRPSLARGGNRASHLQSFQVRCISGRISGVAPRLIPLNDDLGHIGSKEGGVKGILSGGARWIIVGCALGVSEHILVGERRCRRESPVALLKLEAFTSSRRAEQQRHHG
jgi:hypothetical protein